MPFRLPPNLFALIFLGLLTAASMAAQNPVYSVHEKPHKAEVSILAVSSSIHQGSGSQEIYLAEVTLKAEPPLLAKLVDAYSSSGLPILRSVLGERHPLRMTLTRNPECDTTGRGFFLDGEERSIFDPGTRDRLKERGLVAIPCFTVSHDATRLAK